MDLLKNKYLWSPFIIFALVFLLDKIAFIPAVQKYLVAYNKIEPMLYESREDLFQQLVQQDYPERTRQRGEKLGAIFGTSRSSEFDPPVIARTVPASYTYNFSAPFASPVFYYYWLDRMQQAGIQPDFVLIEADGAVLTKQALDYQLAYGLDAEFVLRHLDLNRPRLKNPWLHTGKGLNVNDAETFFLKHLFGFYKYPLKTNNIKKNKEEMIFMDFSGRISMIQRLEYKDKFRPLINEVNRIKLGGIPNAHQAQPLNAERMELDTRTTVNRDLKNFKPYPTQVIMFRNLLSTLASKKIPTIIYVPVVSDTLRKYKHEHASELELDQRIYKPFHNLIEGIRKAHPESSIRTVDLNEDPRMDCRHFQDAYHLSGHCFPRLSELLFSELPQDLRK